MEKIMYIVKVCMGECEDYTEYLKFVTENIEVAEKWVNRYNKIIKDNKERIQTISNKIHKTDFEENIITPLWFYDILYENPEAQIEKIQVR